MTDQITPASGGQGGAPAVAATAPVVGATAAPAAPVTGQWFDTFDDDAKGYVQNKGWKDPADLLGSYRNLEKLTGAGPDKLLKMPSGTDQAELDAFYTKLGRPQDAAGYKLPVPDGDDGEFAKVASNWFHEAGLSAAQAEKIAAKWNDHVAQATQQQQAAQEAEYKTQILADDGALKKEWGAAYDQNINVAKMAAQEFGFDGPAIDKLEEALGFAGLMKFMHNIGSKIGEASFVSGDGAGGAGRFGVLAPAQAQARINDLRKDAGFVQRYSNGDAEARAEMERLHKLAYPGS